MLSLFLTIELHILSAEFVHLMRGNVKSPPLAIYVSFHFGFKIKHLSIGSAETMTNVNNNLQDVCFRHDAAV